MIRQLILFSHGTRVLHERSLVPMTFCVTLFYVCGAADTRNAVLQKRIKEREKKP